MILVLKLTGWTLRHPWITAAVALLMLGGSWHLFDKYVTRGVVWGRFGGGQDTYIRINIELPRGEELARMEELARHFENRLKAMPEVERFVTNVDPRYANITATFPDSIANSWIPVAIKEQMVAYSRERTPTGRIVTPQDVAAAVAFLCSPDAAMIVGQTLIVDGGYSVTM